MMKSLVCLFFVLTASVAAYSTQLPQQLKLNATVHLKNSQPYAMQIELIKKDETSKKARYKGFATASNWAGKIEVRMEVKISNMYRIKMSLEDLIIETEKQTLENLLTLPLSAKAEVWETAYDDLCGIGDDFSNRTCRRTYRTAHGNATLQVIP